MVWNNFTAKQDIKCELVNETERAEIYKCGNTFTGKAKPLEKGLHSDIFTVRSEIKGSNIKKALNDLGGLKSFIEPDDKVYIKTEFSFISTTVYSILPYSRRACFLRRRSIDCFRASSCSFRSRCCTPGWRAARASHPHGDSTELYGTLLHSRCMRCTMVQ